MNNSSNHRIGYADDTYFTALFITEGIIIFPTIFGNLLLVYCIIVFRTLHKQSYILICNLAISDLLFGLIFVPYDMLSVAIPQVRQNKYACLVREAFLLGFIGASILNLLVVSIERYTAIKYPLWHYKLSKKYICIPISISWLTSLSLACLPFGWNDWNSSLKCVHQWNHVLHPDFVRLWWSINITAVLISFIMLIAVYISVNSIVKKRTALNIPSINSLKSSLEKTKLFTVILGFFVMCWGPYCVIVILTPMFPSNIRNFRIAEHYSGLLAISNAAVNWMIYGLRNRRIRHAFKTTLCKHLCKSSQLNISSSRPQSISSISGMNM